MRWRRGLRGARVDEVTRDSHSPEKVSGGRGVRGDEEARTARRARADARAVRGGQPDRAGGARLDAQQRARVTTNYAARACRPRRIVLDRARRRGSALGYSKIRVSTEGDL